MAQYSCKDLNNQITFYPDAIDSCCSGFLSPRFYTLNDKKIDYDSLVYSKNKFVDDFKNGKILPTCMNCHNLSDYDKNLQFNKFTKILVNHFTCCNCACIYCVRDSYIPKDKKQSKPKYELFPIIKEMYKRKLISEERIDVEFQGGDIGCLKEFNNLVKIFSEKNDAYFHFFTNNIVYYDSIKNLFNDKRAELIVSLDCGSRDTYKKIKQTDKFENVIKNLSKYVNSSKYPYIVTKYILIKNINDNYSEIDKFLNVINNIGLKLVCIEIDYNNCMELVPGLKTRFEVPKHYYSLIDYFIENAKNMNIGAEVGFYSKQILDKGYFE